MPSKRQKERARKLMRELNRRKTEAQRMALSKAGGKASAAKLTAAQRHDRAKKAGRALVEAKFRYAKGFISHLGLLGDDFKRAINQFLRDHPYRSEKSEQQLVNDHYEAVIDSLLWDDSRRGDDWDAKYDHEWTREAVTQRGLRELELLRRIQEKEEEVERKRLLFVDPDVLI